MRIPKQFKLLGRTIEVKHNPRLFQERNWNGAACYEEGTIELQPICEVNRMSVDKAEQVFCHELAHFLLYVSGAAVNHDLKSGGYIHNNEEFVDLLGSCVHQVLTTMEYQD